MVKSNFLPLGKYSLGVGDRFAQQASAQLRACLMTVEHGVEVIPVWNKSNREHLTLGSQPGETRSAADRAVHELKWKSGYHVDADHIRLDTVGRFLPHCDFYTIDVADAIGQPVEGSTVRTFVNRHSELVGNVSIPGIDLPFQTSSKDVARVADTYLAAVRQAGAVYRHIASARAPDSFVTEISMDETDRAQTPLELLVILAAIADEEIPIQTIAPKFAGRFNKGVDYVGDLENFEREFSEDLAVVTLAIRKYGLPGSLKLSVHSGSDKFSIYASIRRAISRSQTGLHLKTAGTSWLEELIGLAEAGGEGLELAKEVYTEAFQHRDELCAPYASVIDIQPALLPAPSAVHHWPAEQYVRALRHEPDDPEFNPHFRQLLHVGYKIAGKMGDRYLEVLRANAGLVQRNVTDNLFRRHLQPLFLTTPGR